MTSPHFVLGDTEVTTVSGQVVGALVLVPTPNRSPICLTSSAVIPIRAQFELSTRRLGQEVFRRAG